jgi:cytochrome c5
MKYPTLVLAISLAGVLSGCGNESAPPAGSAAAPAETAAAPAANPAPAPAAPAPTAPAAPAAQAVAAGAVDGGKIYNSTCALCHAAGVAGAPAPGNKEDWAPRIAQGNDTLYKHAMEGYTGAKGMMPPRGGNPKLTDEEIKAAVDYMVQKSG